MNKEVVGLIKKLAKLDDKVEVVKKHDNIENNKIFQLIQAEDGLSVYEFIDSHYQISVDEILDSILDLNSIMPYTNSTNKYNPQIQRELDKLQIEQLSPDLLTHSITPNPLGDQCFADIRFLRTPESYKGKGIRYAEEEVPSKGVKDSFEYQDNLVEMTGGRPVGLSGVEFQQNLNDEMLSEKAVYDIQDEINHFIVERFPHEFSGGQRQRLVNREEIKDEPKVFFKYEAENYPHELSGGQQQRVSIARALQPELKKNEIKSWHDITKEIELPNCYPLNKISVNGGNVQFKINNENLIFYDDEKPKKIKFIISDNFNDNTFEYDLFEYMYEHKDGKKIYMEKELSENKAISLKKTELLVNEARHPDVNMNLEKVSGPSVSVDWFLPIYDDNMLESKNLIKLSGDESCDFLMRSSRIREKDAYQETSQCDEVIKQLVTHGHADVDGMMLTNRFGIPSERQSDILSFDVNQGEGLGFIGPNGAGKMMTMRMIQSLETGDIKSFEQYQDKFVEHLGSNKIILDCAFREYALNEDQKFVELDIRGTLENVERLEYDHHESALTVLIRVKKALDLLNNVEKTNEPEKTNELVIGLSPELEFDPHFVRSLESASDFGRIYVTNDDDVMDDRYKSYVDAMQESINMPSEDSDIASESLDATW